MGWCPHDAIAEALPHDTTTGRWEQARLKLSAANLIARAAVANRLS